VEDIGEHFLADTAFTGDEDTGFGRCDEGGIAEHGLHERAVGDDPGREMPILIKREGSGRGDTGGALYGLEEFVEVDGFGEVIDGAVAHGLDGLADIGVGRDEQDGEDGVLLACAAERVEAGDAGHPNIGDHHVDGMGLEGGEGSFAGFDGESFEALGSEEGIEEAALAGVVIDDEESGGAWFGAWGL
jgi:hypothetical protein